MIRKATEKDVDQIIDVLSKYHFKILSPVDNKVIDEGSEDLLTVFNEISELDLANGFVAELEGRIVGFSHYKDYRDNGVKTTLLSVLPDSRKHGFGKLLQIARMKEAYEKGSKKMTTFCDNQNAVDWYIKHFGYKEKGTEMNVTP